MTSIEKEGLRAHIDTTIPDTLIVGEGNALYIAGWCYHPSQIIRTLHIVIDEVAHRVKAFRMARPDVLEHFRGVDPIGNSYRSGFWTIVPIARIDRTIRSDISIRAVLADGEHCIHKVASITLEPAYERRGETQLDVSPRSSNQPLIAICMATHNPAPDLFAKQIRSIRDQTYSNWICIVSDDNSTRDVLEMIRRVVGEDKRFYIYPAPARLGFYRNFERCLSLVPEEAQFVALSDQDDFWHSDKLEVLLSRFDDRTTLVYSDMNIVDDHGNRKSSTFWTNRPNNYTNLASLILCNSITGAASLFSRRLLSRIIPLPETTGDSYHDHWIGCVALAMGTVKFVDHPLYDYVQHSGNILGYNVPPAEGFQKKLGSFLRKPLDFLMYARHFNGRFQSDLKRWEAAYFSDLMRVKLLSLVLELRCDQYVTKAKRIAIRHIIQIDESFLAGAWLAIRSLRNVGRITETMGAENYLFGAISWKRFRALESRLRTGTYEDRP